MAKKLAWPKIKFSDKGPKIPAGGFDRLGFGWNIHYYDFLHRWNGGSPSPNCFKTKIFNDEYTVAKVKHFYGIYHEQADCRDLRHVVYRTWNDLPRGALPIAEIDIEDEQWDLCTLLTFTWTDRWNKIYLLANPHDCGPFDPDDLSELTLVANSLPKFLELLRPLEYYQYRSWYELSLPARELQTVADSLIAIGIEDVWGHLENVGERQCSLGPHSRDKYSVWLARPNVSIRDVRPPTRVDAKKSILAIDGYRWTQPPALKSIKAALKTVGLDRKIKRIGETQLAKTAGPFDPSQIT